MAINSASIESHQNYSEKKEFSFPILSDPAEKVLVKFKSQKDTGKGVLRTVYALDPKGNIIFAERGMANYDDIFKIIKSDK